MKKFLLVLAMSFTAFANAQTIENENIKAQKEMEKKGYFGHTEYKLDKIQSININYSITPKVPTDKVNISLHTPEDRPIGVYVTNAQGKKVADFQPTTNGYIKEGSMNISSLKAGKYIYVIYWNEDTVLEIPFEKK